MNIDWFTVGAQIANFLVLVLLLRHFLYQPIVKTMEDRQQALIQTKQQADAEKFTAEEKTLLYRDKLAEFEEQKKELLNQAKQVAELEKDKKLQALRVEITETGQHWRDAVNMEKNTFLIEIRQTMGSEIMQIVRKVLADLGDADLNQQLLKRFLKKLQDLSDQEKQKLKDSLTDLSPQRLKILSSFDLSASQIQEIVKVLKQQYLLNELELESEIAPDLLCGLVLKVPGGSLEWNIANFLTDVEGKLSKNLTAPVQRG